MRVSRAWLIVCALLVCAAHTPAAAAPIPHGTLELVAENQWIAAGHDFNLGMNFQLEKGWHVYWVNPGDSGEPPRVTWHLPVGITAGAIDWPAPRRLGTRSVVDYGYENEVMLIVPMHAGAGVAAQRQAEMSADVKVLVCREICIPGKAQVSLTLPVQSQPPARDARTKDLFAATRQSLPRAAPASWRLSVEDAKDTLVLSASVGHAVEQAGFFPLAESQIDNAAPQRILASTNGFRMTLRKSEQLAGPIHRLKGVLTLDGGQAYLIDVPVNAAGSAERN